MTLIAIPPSRTILPEKPSREKPPQIPRDEVEASRNPLPQPLQVLMAQNSYLDNPLVVSSIDRQYPPVLSIPSAEPKTVPVTLSKAGFWIRSIAYILDQMILSAMGLVFFAVGHVGMSVGAYLQTGILSFEDLAAVFTPTFVAMKCLEVAYFTYFHGHTGQTIGKMCCGLKVVNTHGEVISYRRALLRWAGYILSSVIFYLGFLWVAVDRNRQGLHDKVASTYVIKI